MRGGAARVAMFTAILAIFVVSTKASAGNGTCRVHDQGKLAGSVPTDSICAEIKAAIASQAPTAGYHVEITVFSPSRLTAELVVNGKALPVQNFAVMDRNLSEGTIKRFAHSLAAIVAQVTEE